MITLYQKLSAFIAINFIAMYLSTYIFIEDTSHFYFSINRFYVAGSMAAFLTGGVVLLFSNIFTNKRLNNIILLLAFASFVLFFRFARTQTLVGNRQFMRTMISHHSGAIVMCERAFITEPKLRALCKEIARDQKAEIEYMRERLRQ